MTKKLRGNKTLKKLSFQVPMTNRSPRPDNNFFEDFFFAEVTANKNIKSHKISGLCVENCGNAKYIEMARAQCAHPRYE